MNEGIFVPTPHHEGEERNHLSMSKGTSWDAQASTLRVSPPVICYSPPEYCEYCEIYATDASAGLTKLNGARLHFCL